MNADIIRAILSKREEKLPSLSVDPDVIISHPELPWIWSFYRENFPE